MEKQTIDIFGEKALDKALKKLNIKIIKCSLCHKKLSKQDISCFYPKKKGGVGICCSNSSCFFMASTEARYFEVSSTSSTYTKA